jgi:LPS-assembly protein
VFYLPWFMFPIDDRRQSGFLFPSIGTSTSGGLELGSPYYLNLAPNYDATVTPVYMSKRGTLLNSEFRYLTETGEGDLGGGFLDRDEMYDDDKRYLGFWHHSSNFRNGWTAGVDYNKVSDDDYFIDIDTDLSSSSLTYLNQSVITNYRTDHWNFQALAQQFQTIDINVSPASEPYKRVPQLRVLGYDLIGEEGAYWFLGTEAVVFEHPHDYTRKPAEAQRLTLSPGVGYQFENAYSYVEPKLRSVSTQYDIVAGTGLTAEELADFNETPDINTYVASIDSGLTFERSTEWFERAQTQTLEPRAFLLYVPREREQVYIPRFDTATYSFSYDQLFRDNRFAGGDRYGDEKKLSLGLTSRLISDQTGEEWLRLSVGQAFYFAHRYVQLTSTAERETDEASPMAGRVVWQLGQNWFFYNDVEWDSNTNNIDNMNTGFQINRDNEYLLNVSYLYHEVLTNTGEEDEDEPLKQTDVSFILPLTARWSWLGRWGYDMQLNRSFDNLVGLEYDSCCWKFRVVNRRFLQEDPVDEDEVKPKAGLYFQIELKGLASTSKKADSLLESSISGYRDREDQRKYRF